MQTITFYMSVNGVLYVADERHVKLFEVLGKLGLKQIPSKSMSVLTTTTMQAGTYTIDLNGRQQTVVIKAEPELPSFEVKLPVEDKFRKGPDRDQRRQWRTESKKLARNTGRTTGRR